MLLRRVVGSAGSVAAVAAGRDNVCECFEIEFDNGLERLGGRSAGEGFGQGLVPSGVFGLQGEQFGDGIIPSLGSGTFISGSAIPDKWRGLIGLQPSAVTGLSLGIAEGVLALGLASSGHDASPSRNGIELVGCSDFGRPAASSWGRLDGTGVGVMSSRRQQVDVLAEPVAGPFDFYEGNANGFW